MWATVIPALITLIIRILDTINSPAAQAKMQEARNEKQVQEIRKALSQNDSALCADLLADQHDRVLNALRDRPRR